MKRLILVASASLLLHLTAVHLHAQESPIVPVGFPWRRVSPCPCVAPPDCPPATPGQTGQPGQATPAVPNPTGDAFAQAPEAGTQPAASANPALFGDLGTGGSIPRIGSTLGLATNGAGNTSGTTNINPGGPVSGKTPNIPYGRAIALPGDSIAAISPLGSRASFKITEDESPVPTDRFYFNYNYYNDVDTTNLSSSRLDLSREVVGIEKTFLEGNASLGLRVPYLELTGNSDFDDYHIGDISMVFKYALINDRQTGNVVSTGMVLTAPTGERLQIEGQSAIDSTVFQPFVGFLYNYDAFFVQGFSSVAVPTDIRDITLLFNSIGAGYHLLPKIDDPSYLLRDIIPVAELHINTPLNHRGSESLPIGFPDTVDMTAGMHFVFRHATVGIAVGTPLTGPKPFELEGVVNVNFHF